MKFLLILLSLNVYANCSDITDIRNEYHKIKSEKDLLEFIENASKSSCDKTTPYLASAIMRQAEYSYSPTSKYSYYKKGKALLEEYISKNPNCIEGRYVRYIVQTQLPDFLGYSDNIKTDQSFVKTKLSASDLPASYQSTMRYTMKALQ